MSALQQVSTQLGGSSAYGAGEYGAGLYGTAADNWVVLSPTQGEVWDVDYVVCSSTSQSFTQFVVYINVLDQSGLLGTTYDGNGDMVQIPETVLRSADVLIGVWYGGDVGATATATVMGDIFTPE